MTCQHCAEWDEWDDVTPDSNTRLEREVEQLKAARDEAHKKYQEAMEIMTRWRNLDGVDVVAKLMQAEERAKGLQEFAASQSQEIVALVAEKEQAEQSSDAFLKENSELVAELAQKEEDAHNVRIALREEISRRELAEQRVRELEQLRLAEQHMRELRPIRWSTQDDPWSQNG